jgi:predicted PurR-regulated permease PerM
MAEPMTAGSGGPGPRHRRAGELRAMARIAARNFGLYFRNLLIGGITVGVLAAIALKVIGVPHAAILGAAAGVLNLVPSFGAILGAIPAVLVALLESPRLALWTALLFLGIQLLDNLVIAPRLHGGSLGLPPLIVLGIVLVVGVTTGPLGVLLAVPVVATLRDLVRYERLRKEHPELFPQEILVLLGHRRAPSGSSAGIVPPGDAGDRG